jgi:hypothetical protein
MMIMISADHNHLKKSAFLPFNLKISKSQNQKLLLRHDFGFTLSKCVVMKSAVLITGLSLLSLVAVAQPAGRVPSGLDLRWGMNGSIEIMDKNLSAYHSSYDTMYANRQNRNIRTTSVPDPTATRLRQLTARCDPNSLILSWQALQQQDASTYEVEQSSDGNLWSVVGVVPANRHSPGANDYTFTYYQNAPDAWFRVTTVTVGGARLASGPVLQAPCNANNMIGAYPNPVYSTTSIRIGSAAAAKVKMTLLNAAGAALWSRDASLTQGPNQVPVDLSTLPHGSYSLLISWMNGRQETIVLVKQ